MLECFVARRRPAWERLESLLARTRNTPLSKLSAEEILELGHLYRQAASDLSIVRRDYPGDRLGEYLNGLVARAHAAVYRSRHGEWGAVAEFFRWGFPALFRVTLPFTAAAFLIFFAAGTAGFFAVLLFPDSVAYLAPERIATMVKEQRMWTEEIDTSSEILASFIMVNNIRVTLLAFAGGALFGAGTLYVLVANGLSIGSIAGICHAYGLSLRLWSFVAPHGAIELTVIFIVGGAGLRLAWALLHPGYFPRRETLSLAAAQVVRLLFGCVPLLAVAGAIEGFISPSPLPPAAKLAFGAVVAVLLYSYLLLSGRRQQSS